MELLRAMEEQARAILPVDAHDYLVGGAEDERTLAEATPAWERWALRPRLHTQDSVEDRGADTSLTLLGHSLSTPVLLAPVGVQRLFHADGEVGCARAAAAAGSLFCLSTRATTDLADVAAAADGPRWFQLYVDRDRAHSERILDRAVEHGYSAIVLTVDLPAGGHRDRDLRHAGVGLPPGVTMATHLGEDGVSGTKPQSGGWDASVRFADIGWVAQVTGLPVVVKGVLHPHDARQAVEHGAAAVIVSTHGGRQLDGAVPSAAALADVVAAVGARVPVLVDGGLRSGAHVATALALGARAVLIGRPYVWALAAQGEHGVRSLLEAYTADLRSTMEALGTAGLSDLDHKLLRPFLGESGNGVSGVGRR